MILSTKMRWTLVRTWVRPESRGLQSIHNPEWWGIPKPGRRGQDLIFEASISIQRGEDAISQHGKNGIAGVPEKHFLIRQSLQHFDYGTTPLFISFERRRGKIVFGETGRKHVRQSNGVNHRLHASL